MINKSHEHLYTLHHGNFDEYWRCPYRYDQCKIRRMEQMHTHDNFGDYLQCPGNACICEYKPRTRPATRPSVTGTMAVRHNSTSIAFYNVTQASYRLYRDRIFSRNPDAYVFYEGR